MDGARETAPLPQYRKNPANPARKQWLDCDDTYSKLLERGKRHKAEGSRALQGDEFEALTGSMARARYLDDGRGGPALCR